MSREGGSGKIDSLMPTIGQIRKRRYVGETSNRRCPVKACQSLATEPHHILYKLDHGEDVVRYLCHEHHLWITRAESHLARRVGVLYPATRWRLYHDLIEGRMKRPRRTKRDIEWEENGIVEYGTEEQRRAILRKWNGG